VEEDRLLKQLKEDLAGDFAAVKPLMKSWKRALWLFPLSLLLMEVTLAVFHLRPDHVDLGPLALWGFCSLQILASYMIFAVSLEACIPGSGRSRTFLISVGLIGLVIYLAISWFTFRVWEWLAYPPLERLEFWLCYLDSFWLALACRCMPEQPDCFLGSEPDWPRRHPGAFIVRSHLGIISFCFMAEGSCSLLSPA
jgi:hypothetical protein